MNNNQITCTVPYGTLRNYETMAEACHILLKYFNTVEKKQSLLYLAQKEYGETSEAVQLIKDYLGDI